MCVDQCSQYYVEVCIARGFVIQRLAGYPGITESVTVL